MNTKINDLIKQSYVTVQTPSGEEYTYFSQEKFAELIVRECCNKIERKYKYALGEKTQWAMSQDVQDLLKEHFGVEE